MNQRHPTLIGVANHATIAGISTPVDLVGVYLPIYLVDGIPQVQTDDAVGNLTGFTPTALTPAQWRAMPAGIGAPNAGDPCHVGFVANSDRPHDVTIASWPDISRMGFTLVSFNPEFSVWMEHGGRGGYDLARFLSQTVPTYVRHGANFSLAGSESAVHACAEHARLLAMANPQWLPRGEKRLGPVLQGP